MNADRVIKYTVKISRHIPNTQQNRRKPKAFKFGTT